MKLYKPTARQVPRRLDKIPTWHKGMTTAEYIRKFDTLNGLKSVKYK